MRAAVVRGLLRPVAAAAAFLAFGVATGLVPVAGPVGERIDTVFGEHLKAHVDGTSGTLSNPIRGRIVPGTGDPLPPKQAEAIERAIEESRRANLVDALVKANDCYTGESPAPGVVPRWAVVTLPGRDPALVPSDVGFGIWLEGDPGQQHAFCP